MTSSVALNLLWLRPGLVGGSEESTLATVRGLVELGPSDLDLRLLVPRSLAEAHPDVVAALPTASLALGGRSRPARVVAESTWLRKEVAGLDLVHHAGGTAPAGSGPPYVLTLHDLQPLQPRAAREVAGASTHSAAKRAYLRAVVPRSVRSAQRIVVPSAYVRSSVLDTGVVAPERVVVVPHGVERSTIATPAADMVARHGLDGPVVLYPAITYPHKDHATLVGAFARLLPDHPTAVLVLTGRPDTAEAAVLAQVERLGIGARVRRLGRVPAADLAGLYDLAAVVAVPSRYEGFGLPAAEAMAHGAPVVAANATALPEVVGDAGILVEPGDGAAWAAALGELLADPVRRAALGEAGQARARGFGRAANAAAMAEVYRSALG